MKKLFSHFWLILIGLNLVVASWFVINGDLQFYNDVGRDFLLFEELEQKGLVLLGARAGAGGFYHAPLWTYLNYPAYVLGKGNAVVVGWYWVGLTVLALVGNFYIAKSLFNQTVAKLFGVIVSLMLAFYANGLNNALATALVTPIYFFTLVKLFRQLSFKWIVTHLLLAGVIFQLDVAVGAPLLILSSLMVVWKIVRARQWKLLVGLLFLVLPASTFIAFDLRHDFFLTKSLLRFAKDSQQLQGIKFSRRLFSRLVPFTGMGLFYQSLWQVNILVLIVYGYLLFKQLKDERCSKVYRLFIYVYGGYYLLSLLLGGVMLNHHIVPLVPLSLLVFCSFILGKNKKLFGFFFAMVMLINLMFLRNYWLRAKAYIGKNENSWKFLTSLAGRVYQDAPGEFGYFVYAPDMFAYQQRYAMHYLNKVSRSKGHEFTKMPTTYLVIAPPPADNPFMQDEWWTKNQVRIASEPAKLMRFDNGYKVEKYLLSQEETQVGFDENIKLGIHFR